MSFHESKTCLYPRKNIPYLGLCSVNDERGVRLRRRSPSASLSIQWKKYESSGFHLVRLRDYGSAHTKERAPYAWRADDVLVRRDFSLTCTSQERSVRPTGRGTKCETGRERVEDARPTGQERTRIRIPFFLKLTPGERLLLVSCSQGVLKKEDVAQFVLLEKSLFHAVSLF